VTDFLALYAALVYPDRVDDETKEPRWHAIGAAPVGTALPAVFVVVHAYRETYDGQEITRIISARGAEKHEIRRYKEEAVDEG
jgi:uncharacterized DUF497 family protein